MELSPEQLTVVQNILRKQFPAVEVRVFGSRVKGSSKPHSDLDLAIMTDSTIFPVKMAMLKEAFSESNLPFKVDCLDWAITSDSFKECINSCFEIIQSAN